MAAVFVLAVSTAGLRVGSLPRRLGAFGYGTGLLLLLTPPFPRWIELLFPLWVIALSLLILVRNPPTSPVESE